MARVTSAQRRFLLVEQPIAGVVLNLAINAAIAWLLFRHRDRVPLWGPESIAGDTIGTTFLLPLITCLVLTPIVRRQVRRGAVAPLAWTRETHPWLRWLPRNTLGRGAALGAVSLVAVAPATLLVLAGLGVTDWSVPRVVAFKAGFAALEGAFVNPVLALWAIAEVPGTGVPRAARLP
jgi:hypothetical protein